MIRPPLPSDETSRLEALKALDILDTPPEEGFDRITRLASNLLGTPIALVSLVDHDRQWFKSKVGIEASQTPRDHAFCAYTVLEPTPLIVEDALSDPRFQSNPLVTKDPNIRFYAGAPLTLESGHSVGAFCVIDRVPRRLTSQQQAMLVDITGIAVDQLRLRRKLIEVDETRRQLERVNADLSMFNHAIAHDLGGPLRHVRAFSELLLEEGGLAQEPRTIAERIERAAKKASAMVEAMSQLSRLEGAAERSKQSVDLPTLLDDVLEEIAPPANAEIERVLEARQVRAHPAYLRQILLNLVSNALKHGAQPPRIRIEAALEGDTLEVRVSDDGPGIPPKDRERVFRPFFRRGGASVAGLGFGLALVARLVELHGGTVGFEDPPGDLGGASVRFSLRHC